MVTHIHAKLDLGDIGMHEALVIGEVMWIRTGPPGSDEGHYEVKLTRVTVAVQLGMNVSVLDVTNILSRSAVASLEEELEAERKRKDEGVRL